jgi:hypothetical protein
MLVASNSMFMEHISNDENCGKNNSNSNVKEFFGSSKNSSILFCNKVDTPNTAESVQKIMAK